MVVCCFEVDCCDGFFCYVVFFGVLWWWCCVYVGVLGDLRCFWVRILEKVILNISGGRWW